MLISYVSKASSWAAVCSVIVLGLFPSSTRAQVGIGTTTPANAAVLELASDRRGLLPPRLTRAQRNLMGTSAAYPAPVTGLVIYQTDEVPGLYLYTGSAWQLLKADNLGDHTATQNLALAGRELRLASGTDANHALGYFGSTQLFNGRNVDGPVLLGYGGGALGTSQGGRQEVLTWTGDTRRVGIGNVAPAARLHVGDGQTDAGAHMLLQGAFGNTAYLRHPRLHLTDVNFGLGAGAFGSNAAPEDNVYLYAFNGVGRDIRFMHTNNGLSDPNGPDWTTDMIIKQGGNVGIGTTTPAYTLEVKHGNGAPILPANTNGLAISHRAGPTWTFYVSNFDQTLQLYRNGVREVEFDNDGGVNTVSDSTAKTQVQPLENGQLAKLTQLQPKSYRYKQQVDKRQQFGLIAQELYKVYPDLVHHSRDDDGKEYWTVNYTKLIPLLLKGVQEQQQQLVRQQDQLTELQKQVRQLLNERGW